MDYKLDISLHAEELLADIIYHIVLRLKNEQAARHLLNSLETVYHRLESNPFQFAVCRNTYLASRGYREAVLPDMAYVVIYSVDTQGKNISVLGIFHEREGFDMKL